MKINLIRKQSKGRTQTVLSPFKCCCALSARLDIRKMQLFVTKEFNFHFVVAGESVILCEIKIQKEKEKKTKIAK